MIKINVHTPLSEFVAEYSRYNQLGSNDKQKGLNYV